MNLYEIDKSIKNCIKLDNTESYVNQETGELIDIEQLNSLQMERSKKIRNIACWYKNLLADAKALEAEEKQFAERKKHTKLKADQLKSYLSHILNGEKVIDTEFKIGWRKSESIELDPYLKWSDVPKEFTVQSAPTFDKVAMKKALKEGTSILGVTLKENKNIQIQ